MIARASHWAVGWVDTLYIHESLAVACQQADDLLDRIESYPILDEDHFSELEDTEAHTAWESSSFADRLHYIRGTRTDGKPTSCFAIRHAYPPGDDQGTIQDRLLGH